MKQIGCSDRKYYKGRGTLLDSMFGSDSLGEWYFNRDLKEWLESVITGNTPTQGH